MASVEFRYDWQRRLAEKYPHLPAHDPQAFSEKMTHWRTTGVPVSYPYGQDVFHNSPGIAALERQAVAEARANGIEPERWHG